MKLGALPSFFLRKNPLKQLEMSVTVEGYLLGGRDADDNFGLNSYEIEARWMLTDQGQYWAD